MLNLDELRCVDFFLVFFIPAKKHDLIPLSHGAYIVVGETKVNPICHCIKCTWWC